MRKTRDAESIKVISPESSTHYATLKYNSTKKQVRVIPGSYDHDQLKSEGIRFVQHVELPSGYELWGYPFKGFKGDPIILTSSGKIDKIVMSVILKKK